MEMSQLQHVLWLSVFLPEIRVQDAVHVMPYG